MNKVVIVHDPHMIPTYLLLRITSILYKRRSFLFGTGRLEPVTDSTNFPIVKWMVVE